MKHKNKFRFAALVLALCLVFSVIQLGGGAAEPNDKLDLNGKIYSLGDGWEPASRVVDNNLSSQYHGKSWWSGLYFDLGIRHDIYEMSISFPAGYLQEDNGVTVYVETVKALNGTLSGDVMTVPDNSAELDTYDTRIYEKHVTAKDGNTITFPVDFTARLFRVRINTDDNLIVDNNRLYAKCTDISVYGSMANDPSSSKLKKVFVDGKEYAGLNFDQTEYSLPIAPDQKTAPVLTAEAVGKGAEVKVNNLTGEFEGKTATITVTSEDGMSTSEYKFTFIPEKLVSKERPILGYVHAWEDVKNTIDDSMDTKWKAFQDWGALFIDLGAEYELSRFEITFGDGGTGVWTYKVDAMTEMPPAKEGTTTTVDNQNYLFGTTYFKNALGSGSTETAGVYDQIVLNGKGRYIRLYIDGCSSYDPSSDKMCVVKDLKIYALEPAFEAKLASITVDGKQINGFTPEKLSYMVDGSSKIGVVDATTTTTGATYKVEQCTKLNGKATITVTSADKEHTAVYTVVFADIGAKSQNISYQKKAVGYKDAEKDTYPGYILDEDPATRYTGKAKNGGVAIDLKGYYNVTAVSIDFTKGNVGSKTTFTFDALSKMPEYTTQNFFSDIKDTYLLERIVDSEDFDTTKGNVEGDNIYFVCDTQTRYLRLVVKKTQTNVSIDGITVYGYSISTNDTSLKSIKVGGEDIVGFDKAVTDYYVIGYTSSLPEISVEAQDRFADVKLTQATKENPTARILVTSSDNSARNNYYVHFLAQGANEKVVNTSAPTSNGIILSGSLSNISDGNGNTVCTLEPENKPRPYEKYENIGNKISTHLIYDLGDTYKLSRVLMMMGDVTVKDVYEFTVDVSYDGKTYTRALTSDSLKNYGASIYGELDTVARYVKITFFGISGRKFPNVTVKELNIYGEKYESLVQSISVNGRALADFNETKYAYSASYDATSNAVPTVTAKAVNGATVGITQPKGKTDTATVTVTKGSRTEVYTVLVIPADNTSADYSNYNDFTEYK